MRKEQFARVSAIVAFVAALLITISYVLHTNDNPFGDRRAAIALVIPDHSDFNSPLIAIWIDAAREEGIPMQVVTASSFLRPNLARSTEYAGVILPDSIAQRSTASFTQALAEYTANGGKLMLVYDAATLDQSGSYYPKRAPFSKLAGVDYALYDSLKANTIKAGSLWGSRKAMDVLSIPPGKSVSLTKASDENVDASRQVLAGYQYGPLQYSSFVTRGDYRGNTLLSTDDGGLAAGYLEQGKGGVLFVNIPLGYLKGQTDGILLHGFLRFFAESVVALPTLSAAPDAKGGLVFNWHVDSNAAINPIEEIEKFGVLSQGPFSIHFTAGPDSRMHGDGLGLDLEHNESVRSWLHKNRARGDALGAHGGWIHDYFGLNVSEDNQNEMEKFLTLNISAVQTVNGGSIREYSAPNGNQPKWVTKWLEDKGFVAYYFTGNGGMGPTRSYREGMLFTSKIWSFPVLTLGDIASFEEAARAKMPESEIAKWLIQVSDFCVVNASVRTFYSHPPGFYAYPKAIAQWFSHTRDLLDANVFRWYTMTEVADFLNRREKTDWYITRRGNEMVIDASNPAEIGHLAWRFPREKYAKPQVERGNGVISQSEKFWNVIATDGKAIRISSTLLR